jgi:hypothetical protein
VRFGRAVVVLDAVGQEHRAAVLLLGLTLHSVFDPGGCEVVEDDWIRERATVIDVTPEK